MSKIITRGFGNNNMIITRGYGHRILDGIREIIDLISCINPVVDLMSRIYT